MGHNYKEDTNLIHSGRCREYYQKSVNPIVQRATSFVFGSVEEKEHNFCDKHHKSLFYGRRGTQTHNALRLQLTELEKGYDTYLYSCGAAAINGVVFSFLKSNDEILVTSGGYDQIRETCLDLFPLYNINVAWYDPSDSVDNIVSKINSKTKILYIESPSSITFEIIDIKGLCYAARKIKKDIVIIVDNSYSSGVLCQPILLGADISLSSGTKYILGTSDRLMGYATSNERCWNDLIKYSFLHAHYLDTDVAYAASVSIRSIRIRLRQHQEAALNFVKGLANNKHIKEIRHPLLDSCPGHEYFSKNFSGANGLFSIVLYKQLTNKQINKFLNKVHLFSYALSWGGYESLITFTNKEILEERVNYKSVPEGTIIRLHIGFEDVNDLLEDFNASLDYALL